MHPTQLLPASAALLFLLSGCNDDDNNSEQAPPPAVAYAFSTQPATAYQRIDRMGMPAVATAVITSKDAYNAANPTDDAAGTFVAEITSNVAALHSALDDDLAAAGLTPASDGVGQAAPLVVPDTLAIDTALPAGFPNGRRLSDPVIDVTLAVVLLDLGVHPAGTLAGLPLNPPANDKAFTTEFPYLATPHTP